MITIKSNILYCLHCLTHTHTNTHCDNYFLIKQLVFVNITNKYVNLCMLCEWQHRYMLMHQTFNPRIHVQFFIPLGLISINSRNKEQVDSQKMLTNDLSNVTVKDGFILFLLPWHHFRFTVLFDEGLGNQNGILDHHRSFIECNQAALWLRIWIICYIW